MGASASAPLSDDWGGAPDPSQLVPVSSNQSLNPSVRRRLLVTGQAASSLFRALPLFAIRASYSALGLLDAASLRLSAPVQHSPLMLPRGDGK